MVKNEWNVTDDWSVGSIWRFFDVIQSSVRCSVSSPDETPRRDLKICWQGCIFDELWGVSSVDETLCRMLDLEGEVKNAKISSFSSDFQTLSKH